MIGNDIDVKVVPLRADEDVVRMRQVLRECLVSIGFSLIEQTKMITAASEVRRISGSVNSGRAAKSSSS